MNDTGAARGFGVALGAYFAAQVLVRLSLPEALELDEAEQTVLAQRLLPGYPAQPPLYTWLQFAFFQWFGVGVLALSLLKNTLLALAYAFTYLSARRLGLSVMPAILAAVSLLLLPQIGWESQRDLAHSVLVLTLAAVSLHCALRLVRQRRLVTYLELGLWLGLGLLAKFNYALFFGALLFAFATLRETRAVVFDARLLLTLLVGALLVSPYLRWVLAEPALATASLRKLDIGKSSGPWRGLADIATAGVVFITPFWLLFTGFFVRRGGFAAPATFAARLLGRYLLALAALLVVMVGFGASDYKVRWMIPLLFVVPVHLFALMSERAPRPRAARGYLALCGGVALLILAALGLRPYYLQGSRHYSDFSYPAAAVAGALGELGYTRGVLIADRYVSAGNLRRVFPDSLLLTPPICGWTMDAPVHHGPLAVAWDARKSHAPPAALVECLREVFAVRLTPERIVYRTLPLPRAPEATMRLGLAFIAARPMPGAGASPAR